LTNSWKRNALEGHEAGVEDRASEHQAMLEGLASVAATGQDASGNRDARQQVRDVDVADDAQQPKGQLYTIRRQRLRQSAQFLLRYGHKVALSRLCLTFVTAR
jgi:hypothetical protein